MTKAWTPNARFSHRGPYWLLTYVLANFGGNSRVSLARFAREVAPAFN